MILAHAESHSFSAWKDLATLSAKSGVFKAASHEICLGLFPGAYNSANRTEELVSDVPLAVVVAGVVARCRWAEAIRTVRIEPGGLFTLSG